MKPKGNERMDAAERLWRLGRDIILTLLGVVVVIVLLAGAAPVAIAPGLVPLAAGLFAAPKWLRDDERRKRERDE